MLTKPRDTGVTIPVLQGEKRRGQEAKSGLGSLSEQTPEPGSPDSEPHSGCVILEGLLKPSVAPGFPHLDSERKQGALSLRAVEGVDVSVQRVASLGPGMKMDSEKLEATERLDPGPLGPVSPPSTVPGCPHVPCHCQNAAVPS